MTTFHLDAALLPGAAVVLPETAAHHARVKRLAVGDPVQLTDGRGTRAEGWIARIARASVDIDVGTTRLIPPPSPLILYAPVADRERMLWLAEKAVELAVTDWRPTVFRRSRSVSPRGEGEGFAAKVRMRMVGALEQSGGAWLPRVEVERDVAAAAAATDPVTRWLLDAHGSHPTPAGPDGVAIILGPEGGMEPEEQQLLVAGGWRPIALARTVLRFETAGVVALGLVRAGSV